MLRTHTARPYWWSILLLVTALLLSVAVGSVFIPLPDLLKLLFGRGAPDAAAQPYATILFSLRMPRTILVALTGSALAGSGAACGQAALIDTIERWRDRAGVVSATAEGLDHAQIAAELDRPSR